MTTTQRAATKDALRAPGAEGLLLRGALLIKGDDAYIARLHIAGARDLLHAGGSPAGGEADKIHTKRRRGEEKTFSFVMHKTA